MRILLTQLNSFPPSSSWHQMLRNNVNVTLVDYLYQRFYALNTLYGTCVTWEFLFTNEFSKRRWEKCITNRAEWTSSSVLHCNNLLCVCLSFCRFCCAPAHLRLLHDYAKIHATSARLCNVLENWREMKIVFRRNILIRTGDLLILFYISLRYT